MCSVRPMSWCFDGPVFLDISVRALFSRKCKLFLVYERILKSVNGEGKRKTKRYMAIRIPFSGPSCSEGG